MGEPDNRPVSNAGQVRDGAGPIGSVATMCFEVSRECSLGPHTSPQLVPSYATGQFQEPVLPFEHMVARTVEIVGPGPPVYVGTVPAAYPGVICRSYASSIGEPIARAVSVTIGELSG